MKTSVEFQAFYQSSLVPILETIDVERKKIAKAVFLTVLVILIVLATTIGIVILGNHEGAANYGNIAFSCLLLVGLGSFLFFKFWYPPKAKGLKSRFKSEVINKMVKFADDSLNYYPFEGISKSEYQQSNIFLDRIDSYHCEDLISGTFGSTAVRFSEVHSQRKEVRNNNGRQEVHWVTNFKGIFFVADFNKNFNGRTVVLTDQAERIFGSFGTMLQKMNKMRDPLIKLEDPDFEKAFAVYSTDAIEANYILSPALMQRILAFKSKSGFIQLSFVDSNVFISIPVNKNLFEAPIFSSLLNYKRLETYYHYLQLCSGIVDDLNLNNRIWTKV